MGVPSNFISDVFREKIIVSNLQPGPTGPSLLPDRGRYILHDCLIGKGIIEYLSFFSFSFGSQLFCTYDFFSVFIMCHSVRWVPNIYELLWTHKVLLVLGI